MNIRSTNLNFRNLSYCNNPKSIVLHHAEASNCTIEDIHDWHLNNGWSGCGYHYFVIKNASIYKGRPDNAIGAHVTGFNKNSLGICAEGSYMAEIMPEMQKKAIIELCKYLCDKYKISKIYGHREVGSSNCPGEKYPLEEIRKAVLSKETASINSFITIDGGGYAAYKGGSPGLNLIIKDYSSDVVRIFATVDDDSNASWAFDVNPPNDNYIKLNKSCNKIINKRNGGNLFSQGANYKIKAKYKIKVKGYNKNGQAIVEKQIVIEIPEK
ncbi:putative N-acetylmuramoyl-L-alanine amidase [Clostridium tetanomorphum DSM 665]|nr:putative N-acetylmuramoyl-L-alanine amidase [Clostridium tetanomorphum DSM 665]